MSKLNKSMLRFICMSLVNKLRGVLFGSVLASSLFAYDGLGDKDSLKDNLDLPYNALGEENEMDEDIVYFWGGHFKSKQTIYVLDYSRSMKQGNKIYRLMRETRVSVSNLSNDSYFNITSYNSIFERWSNNPKIANNENKENSYRFLLREPKHLTLISDPVIDALKQCKKTDRLEAIILVSDGVPSLEKTNESLDKINKENTERVPIHSYFIDSVSLGVHTRNRAINYMRILAKQSGGIFKIVK